MLDLIKMNSSGSNFSNDIQPNGIKNKINKEFLFFDKHYFENRDEAIIDINISGHGEIGKILCMGQTALDYDVLLEQILKST